MSELMIVIICVLLIVTFVFIKTWRDVSNPKQDVTYEQVSKIIKKDIADTERLLNDIEEEEEEEGQDDL